MRGCDIYYEMVEIVMLLEDLPMCRQSYIIMHWALL